MTSGKKLLTLLGRTNCSSSGVLLPVCLWLALRHTQLLPGIMHVLCSMRCCCCRCSCSMCCLAAGLAMMKLRLLLLQATSRDGAASACLLPACMGHAAHVCSCPRVSTAACQAFLLPSPAKGLGGSKHPASRRRRPLTAAPCCAFDASAAMPGRCRWLARAAGLGRSGSLTAQATSLPPTSRLS